MKEFSDYFRPSSSTSHFAILLPLLCLMLVTAFAYWPGLNGNFIFDDFQTLESLGDFNGVRNWETLQLYVQSGHAGPTGRPIAMLSFLLNAQDWPAPPYFFKLTNLGLHLVCGLVLNLLIFRLMQILFPHHSTRTHACVALLASAWWLLNPLQVSTTLYVVQRMTQLSTLFTLLGLLSYVHGRILLRVAPRRGYLWMTLGIAGMGTFATLSKENGAILPLLAWLLEHVLLQPNTKISPARSWQWLFLYLPSMAILTYLAWIGYQSAGSIIPSRGFFITERLLTEARILWQYLYHLIIPRLDSGNFYGDEIGISKSILSPFSTLPACLGLTMAVTLCWFAKKRFPLLTFAFLFFIAAHLIESTTVPLELYFEHRNYLPSLFLALPVCSAAVHLSFKRTPTLALLIIGVISVQTFITWQRASLWGKTEELYVYWAMQSPGSARAQTAAIGAYIRAGQPDLAAALAQQAIARNPDNLLLRLQWISLIHLHAQDQPEVMAAVNTAMTAPYEVQALVALRRMTEECEQKLCNTVESAVMHKILVSLLQNPNYGANPGVLKLVHHLEGRLYLVEANIPAAMGSFGRVQIDSEYPDTGMLQLSLLASHGYYHEALQQLTWVRKAVIEYNLSASKKEYYLREITRLQNTLQEDLNHAAPAKG